MIIDLNDLTNVLIDLNQRIINSIESSFEKYIINDNMNM